MRTAALHEHWQKGLGSATGRGSAMHSVRVACPSFFLLIISISTTTSAVACAFVSRPASQSTVLAHEPLHQSNPSGAEEVAADSEMFDDHDSLPSLPAISPSCKRLFLVRHGEVINPGGDRPVYYGAMDVDLSPLGEKEAKSAAQYLSRYELQHVAASPLKRAIYGANEIRKLQQGGEGTKSDLVIYDGFKELDRGDWCGKTLDEIGRDKMARFDVCDESVTPQNGESFPYLKSRVLNARDELLDKTDFGRASALVSHLQVTRCMLSDALGVPTNKMSGLKVATASVSCIDYDKETGEQLVHFQSFKPEAGLDKAKDMAN